MSAGIPSGRPLLAVVLLPVVLSHLLRDLGDGWRELVAVAAASSAYISAGFSLLPTFLT